MEGDTGEEDSTCVTRHDQDRLGGNTEHCADSWRQDRRPLAGKRPEQTFFDVGMPETGPGLLTNPWLVSGSVLGFG